MLVADSGPVNGNGTIGAWANAAIVCFVFLRSFGADDLLTVLGFGRRMLLSAAPVNEVVLLLVPPPSAIIGFGARFPN